MLAVFFCINYFLDIISIEFDYYFNYQLLITKYNIDFFPKTYEIIAFEENTCRQRLRSCAQVNNMMATP